MKVAFVYDRLNKIGGAEVVLRAFHDLYPDADWYTSFFNPEKVPFAKNWNVHNSFLNRFALFRNHHEYLPWLMPLIFENFSFDAYDLVISIGSAECKGIITKPATTHLHYCLTPTRYLYSHSDVYLTNPIYRFIANKLRAWDQVAATRPDKMIAISTQVKKRIKKYYNIDSDIIFPPVYTSKFSNLPSTIYHLPSNYFLVVSRLVPYKNIDIIVRAFKNSKYNLVVVGTGSELVKLKKIASPNTTFTGFVSESMLPGYYQNCLGFIQANEEDFGISMVEAQAAGKPVIAYASGGALDIIKSNKTGLLLETINVESLRSAIDKFSSLSFDSEECRKNAQQFDVIKWQKKIKERILQEC